MTLDQLGFVGRGRSRHRPRNDPILYGGDYPFIQTGEVKAAELYVSSADETYNELGLAQSKLWEPGTLLITIAANIAETAILREPACFPDSIVGFVPDPDKADVKFIKYYLDTLKLAMQSVSHGTTQDNLSLDKLLSFELAVPPLATQRRMATVLSTYDDLIDNNNRHIAAAEELLRVLFRRFFGDVGLPAYLQSDASLPDAHESAGWETGTLSSVANRCLDRFDDNHGLDLPLIDLARMPERSTAISEVGFAAELATARIVFERGDVLFGAIRPYLHKVLIAPLSGVTNVSVFVLRPRAGMPASYVFSLLFSDKAVGWATQHTGGTKMPVIAWDVFKDMILAVPPQRLRAEFDLLGAPLVARIMNAVLMNLNLRATRDLLLPRVVSGALAVDEIAEFISGGSAA